MHVYLVMIVHKILNKNIFKHYRGGSRKLSEGGGAFTIRHNFTKTLHRTLFYYRILQMYFNTTFDQRLLTCLRSFLLF